MKTYVILLAGGKGSRMKASVNKVLLDICGKTVIQRSIEAFSSVADEMVIVCRDDERSAVESAVSLPSLPFSVRLTAGGNTRQESVLNGLKSISPDQNDIILIHDAARCLVDVTLINRVIRSVIECGTGIPGIPASSTYKICDPDHYVLHTPDRSWLYEIQTPQGFSAGKICSAASKAFEEGFECTDDAGLLEHYQMPVKVVPGSSANIKLTEPEDLLRAKAILKEGVSVMRIGFGYDVHKLSEGRKLILCGVEIPYSLGLLGHSDADVALHALMDAMLGACALGDIGKHFPDTDKRFSGISSVFLLKETNRIICNAGFNIYNADITIVAQKPKLLPYIPQMAKCIASVLDLSESRISIKATTTEMLGFEGRQEGISAYAVCSVIEKS